jgi:hypothetical protein
MEDFSFEKIDDLLEPIFGPSVSIDNEKPN